MMDMTVMIISSQIHQEIMFITKIIGVIVGMNLIMTMITTTMSITLTDTTTKKVATSLLSTYLVRLTTTVPTIPIFAFFAVKLA
jgi:hypothetical protein